MGYYVAQAKGYYDEVGLKVTITPGGGDISETTAVNNGTVDFGVTWVANLTSANAGGMDLLEIAQVYQRSGLEPCLQERPFHKVIDSGFRHGGKPTAVTKRSQI